MIDKKALVEEIHFEFDKIKSELGLELSFEELDLAFKIRDSVFSAEFVSQNFLRQICSRILDNFMGWHSYLNGLLMPSQGYLANQTEANIFSSKEDKDLIWSLIKKTMYFSTEYSIVGFSKEKAREVRFIEEAYDYWKNIFAPELEKILSKANDGWKKQ